MIKGTYHFSLFFYDYTVLLPYMPADHLTVHEVAVKLRSLNHGRHFVAETRKINIPS